MTSALPDGGAADQAPVRRGRASRSGTSVEKAMRILEALAVERAELLGYVPLLRSTARRVADLI
jgi:hypothetical protein